MVQSGGLFESGVRVEAIRVETDLVRGVAGRRVVVEAGVPLPMVPQVVEQALVFCPINNFV
ncbi:hypothetical protein B7R77_22475 [Ralstonia solanacearum K60]|uniref:Uncharacterized protein n=1 Tax=Ralstonia solanacearum K60 TaxID=1091042 RepID=A0AAP7ZIB0_RALSL|nr:hypothetical protein B7R77_22475 [Ralstonia solanacearum K60]